MRIIYFTGKGGTGKSVISCITAIKLADLGHDTLLMSTDPAHSLKDVLGITVKREAAKVFDKFYAVNIDPVKEASQHYATILDYMASVLKARGLDEVLAYEIASMPGMTGTAAMLKLYNIAEESSYDSIVIDTVPSGEALKFLYLPSIIGKMSRRFMKIAYPLVELSKIAEPIIGIPSASRSLVKKEIEILDKLDGVKELLLNTDITSLRFVANPDAFSISNVRRSYIQASLYGVNTDLIVLNKVLPKNIKDAYFENWLFEQKKYIDDALNSFNPIPIKFLDLFPYELKGINKLRMAGDKLYDDEDPINIYYKGETVKINKFNGTLEIIYPAPFIAKKDIEIERMGDELILHIYTDAGYTDLVIPLPTLTIKLSLKSAKFKDGSLYLYFSGERSL